MKSWRSTFFFTFLFRLHIHYCTGFFFFGLWTIVRFTASIERRKKRDRILGLSFLSSDVNWSFVCFLFACTQEKKTTTWCNSVNLLAGFITIVVLCHAPPCFQKKFTTLFFLSRLQSKESRKVKGELTFRLLGHEGEFKQIPLLFLPTTIVHTHCFTSTVFASTLLSCVFVCVVCGTCACCLSLSLFLFSFFFILSLFLHFFAALLLWWYQSPHIVVIDGQCTPLCRSSVFCPLLLLLVCFSSSCFPSPHRQSLLFFFF